MQLNTKTLNNRVVLITGVSSGLGRSLAKKALDHGAIVAGTLRNPDQLEAFNALAPGRAFGVLMDITEPTSVSAGVKAVYDRFGRIDYLANNAGTGLVGAVEETSMTEVNDVLEVNFVGGLRVIRAVLPIMRRQRSGHILQFSSIAGFKGLPGLGVYAAAKAATGVIGETLAEELKPFGIRVTVLTIGVFHTEFAGRSLRFAEHPNAAYAETPSSQFREFIQDLQGKQPNDPDKGAMAIIEVMRTDSPPVHLALGGDAIEVMRSKSQSVDSDLNEWLETSVSTRREAA